MKKSSQRGTVYIVTGPSGAGKSAIIAQVLKKSHNLLFIPTFTTRPIRDGEVEGLSYHFVSEVEFGKMYRRGEFLEWQNVNGFLYGSSAKLFEKRVSDGQDVITSLEVLGVQELLLKLPLDVCPIFVIPPSRKEQETRIRSRATESGRTLKDRIARSDFELSMIGTCEYLIRNVVLDTAADEMLAVIKAHRLKKELMMFLQKGQGKHPVVRTARFRCSRDVTPVSHEPFTNLPLLRINDFDTEKDAFLRVLGSVSYRTGIRFDSTKFAIANTKSTELLHRKRVTFTEIRSICNVSVKTETEMLNLKRAVKLLSIDPTSPANQP